MVNYKDEKQQTEAFLDLSEKTAGKTGTFFKIAFQDMKESAKAQHEVDKANFEAVKAESRANFEKNRGHNTFAKAKADAKESWDDAHMSPSVRAEKMQAKRDEQIAAANERYEAAKRK